MPIYPKSFHVHYEISYLHFSNQIKIFWMSSHFHDNMWLIETWIEMQNESVFDPNIYVFHSLKPPNLNANAIKTMISFKILVKQFCKTLNYQITLMIKSFNCLISLFKNNCENVHTWGKNNVECRLYINVLTIFHHLMMYFKIRWLHHLTPTSFLIKNYSLFAILIFL